MTRGNFRCHREKEGMDDMDLGGTLVHVKYDRSKCIKVFEVSP